MVSSTIVANNANPPIAAAAHTLAHCASLGLQTQKQADQITSANLGMTLVAGTDVLHAK